MREISRIGSVRAAIIATIAAAGLAFAAPPPATADGLVSELKLGVLAHDVPDLWSGFDRERTWADINVEAVLTPSISLFGGTISPALGAAINTNGDTSHFYLDARWQFDLPSGLFFGFGLGAAVHDGELAPVDPARKALGSRVLFHVPLELGLRLDQWNSISVYYEHMSNGGLSSYNEGMDSLGLRWGRKL